MPRQAERLDVAGRMGWRLPDGSTLWDDGEKEVPTSGLSDEQKRNQARIDAGEAWAPSHNGVTDRELAELRTSVTLAGDPEKALEKRKAAAKARSGQKPGPNDPDLPPTDVEIAGNLRIEAKKLLEREIDRLEELKSMAIAGLVILSRHNVAVPGGNPPMRLHDQVLQLLKVADSGSPRQMLEALEEARAWASLTSDPGSGLPNPPAGQPIIAVIPPQQDVGNLPQASRVTGPGGKPET